MTIGSFGLILLATGCAHRIQNAKPEITERDTAELSVSLRTFQAKDAKDWLVAEDDKLHNGDFVYFTVRTNQQAYLYVVLVGADKSTRTLFPTPQYQLAPARCTLRVPASRTLNLSEPAGTENLRVVASLRPLQEADRSLYEELGLDRSPIVTGAQPVVAPCPVAASDNQTNRGRVAAVKTGHAESNGIAQTRFSLQHDAANP